MNTHTRRREQLIPGGIALMIALAVARGGTARAEIDQSDAIVQGVHFTVEGGQVIVGYKLLGPPTSEYRVQLVLKRGSDSSYEYVPKSVQGDVGVGKFGGRSGQITWSVNDEFPGGLKGSDYYFIVQAAEIKKTSGPSVGTIVGIGAAVAGVAATYLIVSGLHSGAQAVATQPTFPTPPGRPR